MRLGGGGEGVLVEDELRALSAARRSARDVEETVAGQGRKASSVSTERNTRREREIHRMKAKGER